MHLLTLQMVAKDGKIGLLLGFIVKVENLDRMVSSDNPFSTAAYTWEIT